MEAKTATRDERHPGPRRTSVLVADDHPVYLQGLVRGAQLRPDIEIVAEHTDGRAALEALLRLHPDVAVLDVAMPLMSGLDVLRAVRARGDDTPVLLLTGAADPGSLYDTIAAGATGYLLKTAGQDEIFDAVVALARGEVRLPEALHASLVRDIRAREQGPAGPVLAEREREVLGLTAAGASAAQIAADLHLSVATIRTHLQNAYHKLGVSDRAAAVAAAMRLGLIE